MPGVECSGVQGQGAGWDPWVMLAYETFMRDAASATSEHQTTSRLSVLNALIASTCLVDGTRPNAALGMLLLPRPASWTG
jgi:hypothetical protein